MRIAPVSEVCVPFCAMALCGLLAACDPPPKISEHKASTPVVTVPETPAPSVIAAQPPTPEQNESAAGLDAKALFAAKCASCHGPRGIKPLRNISADAAAKALRGYKAKTFGGERKAIMEAKAAQLSDAEIQALARYIGTL